MVENNITHLDEAGMRELLHNAVILSTHASLGPKVFRIQSGDIVKCFAPKKGLTLRHFRPKYLQFIRHAAQLKALGFNTVEIQQVYYYASKEAYAVRYTPLAARDLRSLMGEDSATLMPALLSYMVALHDAGIYFRGLHLGNVLRCDNGEFGIIDMADMVVRHHALGMSYRVRNLAHMMKRPEDRALFEAYGIQHVLDEYCTAAQLKGISLWCFKRLARLYITHAQ